MTGQVSAASKDNVAGPRPAVRDVRRDVSERPASFGKAMEDALAQFTRAGPAAADEAGPEAAGQAVSEPLPDPARTADWRVTDALLNAGAPGEEATAPVAVPEPAQSARAIPVAQLIAAVALERYAAPVPAERAAAPEVTPPPGPRLSMPAMAASPVLAGGAGRLAPDDAAPVREPLPVTVVSSAAYPPPPPPVPSQIAAALGGDLAAMATSGPSNNGRPQAAARLLTIALDPPELGSLLVRLKLTGRGLEVAIAAQPQSVAAVREGLDGIARALHDKGIAVEALNVRVAEWRELAATVPAPRAEAIAASQAQPGSQPPSDGAQGFGQRASGEGFGNRRGAAGDGEGPLGRQERREGDNDKRQTLGGVGAVDGRYV